MLWHEEYTRGEESWLLILMWVNANTWYEELYMAEQDGKRQKTKAKLMNSIPEPSTRLRAG